MGTDVGRRLRGCAARMLIPALALLLHAHFSLANAQSVCAEVKILIQQRVSLERQAFDALLQINNGLPGVEVRNIKVNLQFSDEAGNPVVATDNPDNTTASFFFRLDDFDGLGGLDGDGVVPPQSSATARWLIIPTADAGGEHATGKIYRIGATVNYQVAGEDKSIKLVPETITVRPQPRLFLEYFLPFDVLGDDPFTPDVEPSQPFTLGVRVKNIGAGEAKALKIDSAQPEIVENELGLLVNFEILGGYIQDSESSPSLLLDFGNLAAGQSKVGRWNMVSSLSGQFRALEIGYTHVDTLGGALTSLIVNEASIPGHRLIKDVLVDIPGRDTARDFLAYTAGLDGGASDVIRTYESEGTDSIVSDLSDRATLALSPGGQVLALDSAPAPGEVVYIRVPSPYGNQVPVVSASRTMDGSALSDANVWVSKSRVDNGGQPGWEYHLNLFDARPQASYTIVADDVPLQAEVTGRVYVHRAGQPPEMAAPLAGVTILLEGESSVGEVISRTASTAQLGRFRFPAIPGGTYDLRVSDIEGFVNGTHVVGTAGGTVTSDGIVGLVVAPGEAAAGYGFAKEATEAPRLADLALEVFGPTAPVVVGESFTVTAALSNAGPEDSNQVSSTVVVPPGLTMQSGVASNGIFDLASGTWLLDAVGAKTGAELALTLVPAAEGTHQVMMQATHLAPDIIDPRPENNVSHLVVEAEEYASQLSLEVELAANPPRVLALVNCPETGSVFVLCSAAPVTQVQSMLAAANVEHFVTSSQGTFLTQLRTGNWNVFLLSSAANPRVAPVLSQALISELTAYVHAGAGLIVDGGLTHPRGTPPLISIERLVGAQGEGSAVAGTHAVNPMAPELPVTSFTATGGRLGTVVIDSDHLAEFADGHVAITGVSRSAGRAISAGIRLLDVVGTATRGQVLQALLDYVQPQPTRELVIGDLAYASALSSNGDQGGAFQLVMSAMGGSLFIDAYPGGPGTFPTGAITWNGIFGAGSAPISHLGVLEISSAPGVHQVDVALTVVGTGEQKGESLELAVLSATQFASRAQTNLQSEVISDPGDLLRADFVLDELEGVLAALGSNDYVTAKDGLFKALHEASLITSFDTGQIGVDIGNAVRAVERMIPPATDGAQCGDTGDLVPAEDSITAPDAAPGSGEGAAPCDEH
jgi:hypothetical protein